MGGCIECLSISRKAAGRTDEARRKFQRYRTTILTGLIKLAGAEPVPESMTQDKSRELSGEGRRRLLKETLNELNDALIALDQLIKATPPTIPAGDADLASCLSV